jgi:FixJ family two-component response regulator
MKVPIMDDDSTVLKSCQGILEPEGFEVCLVPEPLASPKL